jgi:ribonuclease VapC
VKKPAYVFDSYALVAYLQDEPGAGDVEALLGQAAEQGITIHMSLINLGEVTYLVERRHGAIRCQDVLSALATFPIEFEEVTFDRVLAAARVKARWPLSYADAFVVALAREFDAILVTGDPEFAQVESIVRISWLRPRSDP